MMDIVKQLRDNAGMDAAEHVPEDIIIMQYKAADEIEALMADIESYVNIVVEQANEIARLRAALNRMDAVRDIARKALEES